MKGCNAIWDIEFFVLNIEAESVRCGSFRRKAWGCELHLAKNLDLLDTPLQQKMQLARANLNYVTDMLMISNTPASSF